MAIYPAEKQNVAAAADQIKSGGVVAFPTETVYGLGADALNASAVAQIFEIKNRPHFDPLIVHIADFKELDKIAEVNDLALMLAKKFWPGPLTLVLKKKNNIPDLVTSGLSTVAVRMPNHPVALELIRLAETPIAAPSANPFGYLSPTTAKHVQDQLGDKVAMILDGGPCATGVESTILDLVFSKPAILRAGGIPIEEIEKVVGPLEFRKAGASPSAPGQLEQHYAPRKRLKVLEREQILNHPNLDAGGVLFFSNPPILKAKKVKTLSVRGDLKEAAANLFSFLHDFDDSDCAFILAESVPETGLGSAIMDRLRKASAGSASAH
ncbi:MAG TPA: L-threonylcarbamoyladenylate synthase [Candidatus Omnitrophota bacterium]|nr:L-threonylcarbamoyladenylate synthase [Candidatus Omnitrophota bacterium]